jgi:acyl carrier protein
MLDYDRMSARVAELLGLEIDGPIDPGVGLYDELGLDSFQALQLIVIIESLADAPVPPLDLPELFTMQDAYDYYVSLVGVSDPL